MRTLVDTSNRVTIDSLSPGDRFQTEENRDTVHFNVLIDDKSPHLDGDDDNRHSLSPTGRIEAHSRDTLVYIVTVKNE